LKKRLYQVTCCGEASSKIVRESGTRTDYYQWSDMVRVGKTFSLLVCGLTGAAVALEPGRDYNFESFTQDFGKTYDSDLERAQRKALFEARLADVLSHNELANAGLPSAPSYKRGINALSDLTEEERAANHGLDRSLLHHQKALRVAAPAPSARTEAALQPPMRPSVTSIDWRDKGVVTPVKNQGQCGSCWSFASAEAVESRWAIKTGRLEELSEQFILDCTPNPEECGGQGGCAGGTAELAYDQLKKLGGIPSEWTYPYVSGRGDNSICHGLPLGKAAAHQASVSAAANVTGFGATKTNDCSSLLEAVTQGPVVVSVDAGAWHDYESGIFDGGNASNPELDHAVLLVGFGEENGKGYWLIRNSWTPLWGENGYIRIARSLENLEPCGLDVNPADGNGCRGGPDTVEVCGQNGVCYDGVWPLV